MTTPDETQRRILAAALDLFLAQGLKKTTVDEVAAQAGLTRITVYRYFADKGELVRAAFLDIPARLETLRTGLLTASSPNIETSLSRLLTVIGTLPKGDFPHRLEELNRLYPAIAAEFHDRRVTAISAIFDHLFALAESQGRLRTDLNRDVIRAYFVAAVVNVLEYPALNTTNLTAADIFATV